MWQLLRAASSAAVLATHLLVPARAGGEQVLGVFTGQGLPGAVGRATPVGLIDYLDLLNRRDGGINGVRLTVATCETAFDEKREVGDMAKNLRDPGRRDIGATPRGFGSASYNRGVAQGILIAEAIRIGQRRIGARPLSGKQLQWGLERLTLDEARLAQLGALELLQPLTLPSPDHDGRSGCASLHRRERFCDAQLPGRLTEALVCRAPRAKGRSA